MSGQRDSGQAGGSDNRRRHRIGGGIADDGGRDVDDVADDARKNFSQPDERHTRGGEAMADWPRSIQLTALKVQAKAAQTTYANLLQI